MHNMVSIYTSVDSHLNSGLCGTSNQPAGNELNNHEGSTPICYKNLPL